MPLNTAIGDASSDSYSDLATAATYVADRGLTWPTDTTLQEQALRRATAWLDGTYAPRWPGTAVNGRSQSLGWPRSGATDVAGNEIATTEIPIEVIRATIEAAVREAATPGYLTPDITLANRVVKEKVDVLEVEYADVTNTDAAMPVVSIIEGILMPLLGSGSDLSSDGMTTAFVARA